MAFPVIETSNTTADTSSASVTVNMPSGIVAGDLLMVIWAEDVNGAVTQSGGSDWTDIDQGAGSGSLCRGGCFAKIAAGSDTLTLTSANSQDFSCVSLRISGHGVSNVATDIAKGTAATGADAAPNPPDVTFGTTGDNLVIECFAADDDDDTTTYETSTYTQVAQIQSASSTSSCLCAVARKNVNGSSENPGVMAMAAVEEWRAQTFAVPPSSNITLTADSTSIVLTGQDAALGTGNTADVAAITVTGQDAELTVGYTLVADHVAIALTAQNVDAGISTPVDHIGIGLTGQDATLTVGYTLTAEHSLINVVGQDAALGVGNTVDHTAISLTTQNVDAGITSSVDHTVISLTGQDATLTVGGADPTLDAEHALLTVAAQNIDAGITCPVDHVLLSVAAQNVDAGITCLVDHALINVVGQDATLTVGSGNYELTAEHVTINILGQDATFIIGSAIETFVGQGLGTITQNDQVGVMLQNDMVGKITPEES